MIDEMTWPSNSARAAIHEINSLRVSLFARAVRAFYSPPPPQNFLENELAGKNITII
jgi:hypothetical protein